MASMHFDTLDQMPAGMRRLVEQQLASTSGKKTRAAAALDEAVAAQGQRLLKRSITTSRQNVFCRMAM